MRTSRDTYQAGLYSVRFREVSGLDPYAAESPDRLVVEYLQGILVQASCLLWSHSLLRPCYWCAKDSVPHAAPAYKDCDVQPSPPLIYGHARRRPGNKACVVGMRCNCTCRSGAAPGGHALSGCSLACSVSSWGACAGYAASEPAPLRCPLRRQQGMQPARGSVQAVAGAHRVATRPAQDSQADRVAHVARLQRIGQVACAAAQAQHMRCETRPTTACSATA